MARHKQGEIWLADLNPRFGSEPGKVRPVVVVQTDLLNPHHPSTLICPITTNVIEEANILRVHLNKSNSGLARRSDVLVDQLRAIDNRRLIKKVGTLKGETLRLLQTNLRAVLDLV